MDGEGGQLKNKADRHQISASGLGESIAIQDAKAFYDFVRENMAKPEGDFFKKNKENPVYLRRFHWVPLRGEGSVPRRSMRKYKTFVGIKKKWYYMIDLKKPYTVGCRKRFCHCEHCMEDDYDNCKWLDRCGSLVEVKMEPLPLDPFFQVDVKAIEEEGLKMAERSELGTFLAIETTDCGNDEIFFICKNMTGTDIGPYGRHHIVVVCVL